MDSKKFKKRKSNKPQKPKTSTKRSNLEDVCCLDCNNGEPCCPNKQICSVSMRGFLCHECKKHHKDVCVPRQTNKHEYCGETCRMCHLCELSGHFEYTRPLFNKDGLSCRLCDGVCCPKSDLCIEENLLRFCALCSKHHDFDCTYWDPEDSHNYCCLFCNVCHKCYKMSHKCQREPVLSRDFSADGSWIDTSSDERNPNLDSSDDESDNHMEESSGGETGPEDEEFEDEEFEDYDDDNDDDGEDNEEEEEEDDDDE